jgi:hypothetical protein
VPEGSTRAIEDDEKYDLRTSNVEAQLLGSCALSEERHRTEGMRPMSPCVIALSIDR